MSWIKTISYEDADPKLKRIYDRVKGPNNNIDNILLVHGLRPHSLVGHMTLYKGVLHNSDNKLPKWYLEAIGVYVSFLNNCNYCVEHHFAGLSKLLNNKNEGKKFLEGVKNDNLDEYFDSKYFQGIKYAKKLTLENGNITQGDIECLQNSGFSDGEILEVNQVVSYFNYANRTVTGLGVTTQGDIPGLSPSESNDPENWTHQANKE